MRKFFIFSMVSIGFASALYAGMLIKLIDSGRYPVYYLYLRFFLVGWVISSIIIALIGETKKIGGVKSFLISLFNPALGLIMVLASEGKSREQLLNAVNHSGNQAIPKQRTRLKNTSYTLNT